MFPPELESNAFRAGDEFGWIREQVPSVVDILRSHGMGILGGELWWITDTGWYMSVPQREGPRALYTWVTERHAGEAWQNFVERGASDALAAAERWPAPKDLPSDMPGRILYNLTWVSEMEYANLSSKAQ